jgi:hypothetical protein
LTKTKKFKKIMKVGEKNVEEHGQLWILGNNGAQWLKGGGLRRGVEAGSGREWWLVVKRKFMSAGG